MILTATADSWTDQARPSVNHGTAPVLRLNGGGSSDQRNAYIHFTRPFPLGATILSATLSVTLNGAWASTNGLTCKRVTESWSESTIAWNTQPTATTTHDATATVSGGADGDTVTFDVTDIYSDVSAAAAYFGLVIILTPEVDRALNSAEAADSSLRPTLTITWSTDPNAPASLQPDNGDAVAEDFPVLQWDALIGVAGASQTAFQVQIMEDSTDFGSPTYDTDKVTATENLWDSDDGSFTGFATGHDWYWRVQVWDDNDQPSGWSDTAELVHVALSSLSLDEPSGSTVITTTPTISWTFGGTQTRWTVLLYEVATARNASNKILFANDYGNADTSVQIPKNLIVSGKTYIIDLTVYDDVPRAFGEQATASQTFTYNRDGSPDPVTNLAVAQYQLGDTSTPAVEVTFKRSSAPDYFALTVDGVEVEQEIDPSDCLISGTTYGIIYWGAQPGVSHDFDVEAVVIDTGVAKNSVGAGPVTHTQTFIGIWVADQSAGLTAPSSAPPACAPIYDNQAPGSSLVIGESATTYDLVGTQAPVRITDIIRGYEGAITGILVESAHRDTLMALKGALQPVRLVLADVSIPAMMEDFYAPPRPEAGANLYDLGLTFCQVGEPWPTA